MLYDILNGICTAGVPDYGRLRLLMERLRDVVEDPGMSLTVLRQ